MSSPFRSRLITVYDYHRVDLSDFCEPFCVDEWELTESLLSVRKKYAQLETVPVIECGDFAELRCESQKPKFQKESVSVCVGKNIYSAELEDKLIGLSAGATVEVEAEGATVRVTVKSIQRSMLPELTDTFVSEAFREVETVEELRAWYRNNQFENHVRALAEQAAEAIVDEVIEKSEIIIDESERAEVRGFAEQMLREQCNFNGINIDNVTDAQAQELFGFPSAAAYIDWFATLCEKDISTALLGYNELAKQGKEFTESDYRALLQSNAEEANMTTDELAEQFTFTAYIRQQCAEYFAGVAVDFAQNFIREALK